MHVYTDRALRKVGNRHSWPFSTLFQGYKYLLTTICLASKYPDVVPLKDMSAVSVAEALVEIFSNTGLPRVLLSDQGSQFVSSLMKQLCVRLGIARITISTYHPQSNGCLERLHGTLTPMIRKAIVDKLRGNSRPHSLFCSTLGLTTQPPL